MVIGEKANYRVKVILEMIQENLLTFSLNGSIQ